MTSRTWIAPLLSAALLAPAGAAAAAQHDITLASRASGGAKANLPSTHPVVSGDSRFVAFWSSALNLSADDNDIANDLYRRDLVKDTTVLVSRASGVRGAKAVGGSGLYDRPAVSADGRHQPEQGRHRPARGRLCPRPGHA